MKKHSHNYKGGTVSSHGYKLIFVGKNHHLADVRGYAYEHRVNGEEKIKRKLRWGEIVHHIDGNKLNNSLSNLKVVSSCRLHLFLHRKRNSNKRLPSQKNYLVKCKCGCGGEFMRYDKSNRPRYYISGHNFQTKIKKGGNDGNH